MMAKKCNMLKCQYDSTDNWLECSSPVQGFAGFGLGFRPPPVALRTVRRMLDGRALPHRHEDLPVRIVVRRQRPDCVLVEAAVVIAEPVIEIGLRVPPGFADRLPLAGRRWRVKFGSLLTDHTMGESAQAIQKSGKAGLGELEGSICPVRARHEINATFQGWGQRWCSSSRLTLCTINSTPPNGHWLLSRPF